MSSFGPSIYDTARYTIQGCDCMAMQQLSRNNFSMLLPTYFHFLGHHFWVPFLGPIFGAPYHLKRKFDWSGFKYGHPFLGPKNCIIFDFFSQKRFSSHVHKQALAVCPNNRFAPTCTKTCLGLNCERKIMKILDLTSGTAPSQKLVRN